MSSLVQAVRRSMLRPPRETSARIWEADFIFEPGFLGFAGHFPNDPLLPGIVQIMAAVMTVDPSQAWRLRTIRRSKFQHMIRPLEVMHIRAETTLEAEKLLITARIDVCGLPCSQMTLLLKKE